MSNIWFSIRRQVAVIWHILENIGDAWGTTLIIWRRGHSITSWSKFYPILTTYPPRVGNWRYILYHLLFVQVEMILWRHRSSQKTTHFLRILPSNLQDNNPYNNCVVSWCLHKTISIFNDLYLPLLLHVVIEWPWTVRILRF